MELVSQKEKERKSRDFMFVSYWAVLHCVHCCRKPVWFNATQSFISGLWSASLHSLSVLSRLQCYVIWVRADFPGHEWMGRFIRLDGDKWAQSLWEWEICVFYNAERDPYVLSVVHWTFGAFGLWLKIRLHTREWDLLANSNSGASFPLSLVIMLRVGSSIQHVSHKVLFEGEQNLGILPFLSISQGNIICVYLVVHTCGSSFDRRLFRSAYFLLWGHDKPG